MYIGTCKYKKIDTTCIMDVYYCSIIIIQYDSTV